ncbi:hypothetical protein WG954_17990 [Lacibacter sp. H375]|uniref:hypothetical protein n=1 Tax=Lacibacter sp. H375 TaxID=3133424 RepID=UPI0030BF00E7
MPRLLLAQEVKTNAAIATTRREIITFFINKTDFGSAKIAMFLRISSKLPDLNVQ